MSGVESGSEVNDWQGRLATALSIAESGARVAHDFFQRLDDLQIESKGQQDFVSEADREVERVMRRALQQSFPDDGIVGEEHDDVAAKNEFVWVIDPIDGTANFVSGIPNWCVVLAGTFKARTVIAVIVDPCADEVWTATRGGGAMLNDKPLVVSDSVSLSVGSVGVGYSNRQPNSVTVAFIERLLGQGGVFFRTGSGALMLAYVAAGRLIGYVEPHMYPWDCIAGLLLIEEAGGQVQAFDPRKMLHSGGQVVAACPGVYATLQRLAHESGLQTGKQ